MLLNKIDPINIYRHYVFPKLLDAELSKPDISELRHLLLANAKGNVLELGFGTGLNLTHYPSCVSKLTRVDINPGMNELAQQRVNESPIEVISAVLNADKLPFSDNSFDTVVSTWTLCSISNVENALREAARVLKPGGQFLFLEHGLSRDPKVQKWQHLLNPVNKLFTDGCQINRNIQETIAAALQIKTCEEFEFKRYPRTHGSFYRGSATKFDKSTQR